MKGDSIGLPSVSGRCGIVGEGIRKRRQKSQEGKGRWAGHTVLASPFPLNLSQASGGRTQRTRVSVPRAPTRETGSKCLEVNGKERLGEQICNKGQFFFDCHQLPTSCSRTCVCPLPRLNHCPHLPRFVPTMTFFFFCFAALVFLKQVPGIMSQIFQYASLKCLGAFLYNYDVVINNTLLIYKDG